MKEKIYFMLFMIMLVTLGMLVIACNSDMVTYTVILCVMVIGSMHETFIKIMTEDN